MRTSSTWTLAAAAAAAAVAAVVGASACDDSATKGKPVAQVAAPLGIPAAAESGKSFAFSDADSKLGWVAAKVTRKHEGAFREFHGTIDLVDADPTKSSVSAEIAVASVTTDEDRLVSHLKTPDLLDVAQFPTARFQSTQIAAGGEGAATHTVTGNLELHGVTKSIRFPASIRVGAQNVDIDAEFVIDRQDFGITYPGAPDDLIKDDVLLQLHLHAKAST